MDKPFKDLLKKMVAFVDDNRDKIDEVMSAPDSMSEEGEAVEEKPAAESPFSSDAMNAARGNIAKKMLG